MSMPNSESNDSSEESKKEPSPVSSSHSPTVTLRDSKDGKDIVEGQILSKHPSSLFKDITKAASALFMSMPNSESNDSSEESKKEPSPVSSSHSPTVTLRDSKDGKDIVEGQILSKHRRGFQRAKQKLKINKEGRDANKSNVYFIALFWGILLSRLWLHWEYIMILLIAIMFYTLKKLLAYWSSSIKSSAPCVFILSWWEKLKSWADKRKQALIPTQLSGLLKGGIKVDRTVSLYKKKNSYTLYM